jgi:hypothetical protein
MDTIISDKILSLVAIDKEQKRNTDLTLHKLKLEIEWYNPDKILELLKIYQ